LFLLSQQLQRPARKGSCNRIMAVHCHLIPGNSLGSFRKDNGDGSEKVKKEIGLSKTTTLHV